jgi:hypothetical protein
MFEHQHQPLLPRRLFYRRVLGHALAAFGFVAASLLLGIWGYRRFEHLSWIDALLNAAMILGGMGPVGELKTTGGKLFASFYALFSGVVFLIIAGVLFAPVFHRFLHRFHLEMDQESFSRSGHDRERAGIERRLRPGGTAPAKEARGSPPGDEESSS